MCPCAEGTDCRFPRAGQQLGGKGAARRRFAQGQGTSAEASSAPGVDRHMHCWADEAPGLVGNGRQAAGQSSSCHSRACEAWRRDFAAEAKRGSAAGAGAPTHAWTVSSRWHCPRDTRLHRRRPGSSGSAKRLGLGLILKVLRSGNS